MRNNYKRQKRTNHIKWYHDSCISIRTTVRMVPQFFLVNSLDLSCHPGNSMNMPNILQDGSSFARYLGRPQIMSNPSCSVLSVVGQIKRPPRNHGENVFWALAGHLPNRSTPRIWSRYMHSCSVCFSFKAFVRPFSSSLAPNIIMHNV